MTVLAEPDNGATLVRELRLKRRRSRLPWIYVVYQPLAPLQGAPHTSALPAEKRRHVERRLEIDAVLP